MLLATPFIPPFRVSRLLLTYVVPIVPLATLWDGVVSCLRVYAPEELRALVSGIAGADRYVWEIGRERVPLTPVTITFLVGRPCS